MNEEDEKNVAVEGGEVHLIVNLIAETINSLIITI